MLQSDVKITALPTRYEPLISTFGEQAKTTFVSPEEDLPEIKRFFASAQSSAQGKVLFLSADSGTGKSTFIHSLEVYLPDRVDKVIRLPPPHELPVSGIPQFIAALPICARLTVVNFDGREAPFYDEQEYQTFLGGLNGLLRSRRDLVIIWPVTDKSFADKMVALLRKVGGNSAFGVKPIHLLQGISKDRFSAVLDKILQIANWRIDDAAVSNTEVETLIGQAATLGSFLDELQSLIAQRFDVGQMGVDFPILVIAVSSGETGIRETVRSLRRADSYYIEASRLLMYTKRSNVAEWWTNRATSLTSALPHIIALFNAQLVSVSASTVVHSVLQSNDTDVKSLVEGVTPNKGNAKKVMLSSELYKYFTGDAVDNREYGSSVKGETSASFERIQAQSETHHRKINKAIVDLAVEAGAPIGSMVYEHALVDGLQTDVVYESSQGNKIALELHHKSASESNQNRIAIYILEKLKEYAINYGLGDR